jgi:hypothetical protein
MAVVVVELHKAKNKLFWQSCNVMDHIYSEFQIL